MNQSAVREKVVISTTFFVALCLSVLPLSQVLQSARPDWVILVLIYWVMFVPYRIGIITAWWLGLIVDALQGQLFGQSALILVMVTFFVQQLYQRMQMYALWQQALVVFLLAGIAQFIKYLTQSAVVGQTPESMLYLISALASALLWPCVCLLLNAMRRHYYI